MSHTLLLADDSLTIQRVIELTFAEQDVRVVAVGDGEQAIAALDQSPPDIVLADVAMPGRNGYELAEHIKTTPRLAHIPVVLLTGVFEPVDEGRATAAGCDAVLTKPFEPHMVISRVKDLLSRPKPLPLSNGDAESRPWPEPFRAGTPDASASEIDSYFERLDRAFATLSSSYSRTIGTSPSASAAAVDAHESDTGGTETAAPHRGSGPEPFGDRPITPAPRALPSLADAFTALLDAEQRSAQSAEPVRPRFEAPAPQLSDDLIEEVTRQVADRLSQTAFRETVSEIVTSIAERLVREEIERIKAAIK